MVQTYRVLGPGKVTDIHADDYSIDLEGNLTFTVNVGGGITRDIGTLIKGEWLQVMDEEQISGTQPES